MSYTEPMLGLLLLIAFIQLFRLRRDKRMRPLLVVVVAMTLLSWPPADWLFTRPLEAGYPVRPFRSDVPPEAIVVLSASVNPPIFERPFPTLGPDTYNRCEMALWLRRQWHVPILAAGGPEVPGTRPFSLTMRDFLVGFGVPAESIWTEERSKSTHENAVFGAEILRQHGVHRVALVVEAQCMPRAAACFRKQGIEVLPAPAAFRELGKFSEEILPSWRAVRRNEATLHEVLGLLWYKLHGWI